MPQEIFKKECICNTWFSYGALMEGEVNKVTEHHIIKKGGDKKTRIIMGLVWQVL